jgi:hypothetical protein
MRYKVTEIAPVSAVWEYYVEADSKEEAIDKVANGEVDPSEFRYEGADNIDSEDCDYDAEEV